MSRLNSVASLFEKNQGCVRKLENEVTLNSKLSNNGKPSLFLTMFSWRIKRQKEDPVAEQDV